MCRIAKQIFLEHISHSLRSHTRFILQHPCPSVAVSLTPLISAVFLMITKSSSQSWTFVCALDSHIQLRAGHCIKIAHPYLKLSAYPQTPASQIHPVCKLTPSSLSMDQKLSPKHHRGSPLLISLLTRRSILAVGQPATLCSALLFLASAHAVHILNIFLLTNTTRTAKRLPSSRLSTRLLLYCK